MKKGAIILLGVFISAAAVAQVNSVLDKQVQAVASKVVNWRRHLHQNPELSNREFKTADYIASHLRSLGLEVKTGVAKTGVVAILKGGKPGPVIALRADMDALPVTEGTGIAFASTQKADYNGQQVGVMHACGHDAHVAMLMGAAEVLASMQKDIAGTVKFIFQPAEEGPPANEEGGASLMVKEGVLENPKVDVVFGLHIESDIEVGKIKYKPGAFMASSDWFTIKVKGKGSHGSQPWKGIDPIAVGAQIIQGLQNIVSRQSELTVAPVVITVGKFNAGVRNNIIPEEALLEGTIRTLDNAMQQEVHKKLKHTAVSIAAASDATVEVSIDTKTLVTYNNPDLVRKMLPSLEKAAGKGNVTETVWQTGAEDFSYYGAKVPAFFFYFGGMPKGNNPEKAPPHHTAAFFIDDSMLDVGVKAFCQLVLDYPNAR